MFPIQEKNYETNIPNVVSSYSEMQWRKTSNVNFHLPFQQTEKRKDRQPQ